MKVSFAKRSYMKIEVHRENGRVGHIKRIQKMLHINLVNFNKEVSNTFFASI